MGQSHKIPAALALMLTVLASYTICGAVQAADATVAPPKLADMPISRNWRPGGLIGKQKPQTQVAKPRGGPVVNKIDLNTCTLEQLQNLPGVGPAMGAHIMAGRPYRSFDDLARDGVPLSTIDRIRTLVTVGP
jgi:DNA uptake protein ComE-like DNA-binding protein